MFKTVSDQFGKYSFVKVMAGKITSDMSLRNVRAGSTDKLGRLYTMCGKKAVLADGSTGSINSADIKTYTEGVAEPDGAGMAFAAVSIGFCAIAFFLLFYLGRRPKWDDFVGLPEVGVAETVNEVPEVPEVPADETPPDQPPEE